MKKFLLFLFILTSVLKSQVRLDTLVNRYIGPGTIYTKIKAPSMPWDINVLRVDLKNQYIKIETAKAKELYAGKEQTTSMAKRRSYSGHNVIGAVNADFYNTTNGQPINVQIENGEFIRIPARLSTIGFDPVNKPMLGIVAFKGKVIANGVSRDLNNINEARGTDHLIMYNSFKGASTATNQWGVEALVRPLNAWMVNDTILCEVEKIENSVGNMAISQGRVVISGNGASGSFISSNFHPGDTIKIYQSVAPALDKVKEMLGGFPKIVNNGVNYAEQGYKEEGGPSHAHNKEPRTAAGFSADSTFLYLVTLDGRGASIGATLPELADVMLQLGVAYGINFDGGGSTTMVVRDSIVNFTSDGPERAVANSLLVVSSALSVPDSLNKVAFKYFYNKYSVYSSDMIQLQAYGNDKYNNPVSLDPALLEFRVSPGLGTISKSGLFTASKSAAAGYIYLKYKEFADSSFINIIPVTRIVLNPGTALIDSVKQVQLTMRGYTSGNVERVLSSRDLTFKSSDESVAVVDSNGVIKGKAEGKAKIIAVYTDTIADTTDITVQIGNGIPVVNKMEEISNWILSGSAIDLEAAKLSVSTDKKSEGTGSLKIDYKFTYNPALSNLVILSSNVPFYGLPDSLLLDAYSDSVIHKIYYIVANEANKTFRVNASADIMPNNGSFRTVAASFMNNTPLNSGIFSFPVTLQKIVVQLMYNNPARVSGQTYTGTLYLDNLRIKYPGATTAVSEEEQTSKPKEYSLRQNYPNPFNPSTVIEFSTISRANTTLKVYDLLGREVAVLVNGELPSGNHKAVWNAGSNASGIYLYRLQSGSYVETRKMLLVR